MRTLRGNPVMQDGNNLAPFSTGSGFLIYSLDLHLSFARSLSRDPHGNVISGAHHHVEFAAYLL